jgi:hypothetical protein
MDESATSGSGAPPVAPGPVEAAPRQSNWPTVLGIIACVLGGLAALGGCFGAGSLTIVRMMANAVPPEEAEAFRMMTQNMWFYALNAILYLVLGGLLAIGGVGLLMRRPWSRPTILLWSVLKILYAFGSSIVNYQVQMHWAEAMQNDPSMQGMGGMMTMMMGVFGIAGIVIGILWYSALPVFMIVWFMRRTVRTEVRSWAAAREEPNRS